MGSEGQGEVEEEGRRESNVDFPVGTQGQCNTRIPKIFGNLRITILKKKYCQISDWLTLIR